MVGVSLFKEGGWLHPPPSYPWIRPCYMVIIYYSQKKKQSTEVASANSSRTKNSKNINSRSFNIYKIVRLKVLSCLAVFWNKNSFNQPICSECSANSKFISNQSNLFRVWSKLQVYFHFFLINLSFNVFYWK